ncbi:MAG: hypothetical protein WAL10_29630, partial [Acetobacteraceae bacterium]
DRPLRRADREYLERARRVVAPSADLPIELPDGRRDRYPADAAALQSQAAHHGVRESCARLLSALARLATDQGNRDARHQPAAPAATRPVHGHDGG